MSQGRYLALLVAAALLVGSLLGAPLVRSALGTITFTIPNTLGTQTGTVAVSLIDDNFAEIKNALSGLVAATTDLPLTRAYTGTQRWAKGANLASASTLTLGTDGNYFVVTGTTTIAGLSSLEAGTIIVLRFSGALTLTHSDPALVLLGATNATTTAGDMYWFVSDGGGNWREFWRRPVAGANTNNFFNGLGTWVSPSASAGAITFAGSDTTERTTTSTTTVDLSTITVTSIPTTSGILIMIPWRHTAGAVAALNLGVTLNATAYMPAVPTAANANASQNGNVWIYIPPYNATYIAPFALAVNGGNDVVQTMYGSIARPNAAVTTVIIPGFVGSALITGGIQNVMIYAISGS